MIRSIHLVSKKAKQTMKLVISKDLAKRIRRALSDSKTTNTKEKSTVPRILIIDDDDEFIGILRITLEKAGYDVYTAGNGTEGFKILAEYSVDLVVTDIFMPVMEGIEMILKLRREFPGLKVIAVSGGGNIGPESYLDTASLLGAHTLIKPLVMTEFLVTTLFLS